jgi:protein involved in polysaccharide export with SLBB domain
MLTLLRCLMLPFAAGLLAACQMAGGGELISPALQVQYVPPPKRVVGPAYVLGPADKVRIKVYGETDITGEYEVNSTGFVSVPLAGQIRAAGLTTRQLEGAVRARLAEGIVNDPRVNVEIATYAPFYIHGEVKTAGEFAYRIGLTVQDAVALAGGFTYRANDQKVYVRHAGSMIEEICLLDAPLAVSPGDNIRIPERYF